MRSIRAWSLLMSDWKTRRCGRLCSSSLHCTGSNITKKRIGHLAARCKVADALFCLFVGWRVREEDDFVLAEFFDGVGAQFAVTVAAGLHATKGQVNLSAGCRCIKVDQACLDITHGTVGGAQIVGENGGREAVFGRVSYLNRFLVGGDGQDGDEWAENLFARNAHVRTHTGKNGGFVESSMAICAMAERASPGH